MTSQTFNAVAAGALSSASPSSTMAAPPQGGILEGENPSAYNPSNPIILFIIQASIIITFCRLLHYPLSRLRQPHVIAEVIGGILLGPSVMGHVPGFTDAIFPKAAMPNLSLVANLGLIFFLFLVGLEVDLRYVASNWRVALSVGAASLALPFACGCAIAYGLYRDFRDEPGTIEISFGTYMLFIAIAISITAFPVLCRILTELQLLSTPVGIITLAAGVSNDVVGWILLALCVALVNSGSGLTALWVLLTCVGYALFLIYPVRWAFMWVLRRTRSLQDGPPQSVVALTLLIVLASAFFTGVIGVHPIFGAFLAGIICPHEGGFAVKMTEKVEDLVCALLLPLYFALSGLSTNIGLLDNGITWGYVVAVIVVAFASKFISGTLAARLNGLVWRESAAIGSLMSCKGLVELIVLNIGLQAKILSTRTFTIFVVMALATTFATTPLVAFLYPGWYQRKLEAWKRGEIDWETGEPTDASSVAGSITDKNLGQSSIRSVLVYLRLDNMPTLLAFVSLLGRQVDSGTVAKHPSRDRDSQPASGREVDARHPRERPVEVHGVRLLELSERTSAAMKVSEVDEYSLFDPVINAFRVLGQLYHLSVSGEVAVAPESSFASTLTSKAAEDATDLLLLPWSETGSLSEAQTISSGNVNDKLASPAYSAFVMSAWQTAQCNVAVFITRGFSGTLKTRHSALTRSMSGLSMRSHRDAVARSNSGHAHHVFVPYLGDADSKVAVKFALQLAQNPNVTATIVHFQTQASPAGDPVATEVNATRTEMKSSDGATVAIADESAWFSTMPGSVSAEVRESVLFESLVSAAPVEDAVKRAQQEIGHDAHGGGDIVIAGRRMVRSETTTLGAVADAFLSSGIRASVLVLQAKQLE